MRTTYTVFIHLVALYLFMSLFDDIALVSVAFLDSKMKYMPVVRRDYIAKAISLRNSTFGLPSS